MESEDQSQRVVLAVCIIFQWRLKRIFAVTILSSENAPPKKEYA